MKYIEVIEQLKCHAFRVARRPHWEPTLSLGYDAQDDLPILFRMEERWDAGGEGLGRFKPKPDDLAADDWEEWNPVELFPDDEE